MNNLQKLMKVFTEMNIYGKDAVSLLKRMDGKTESEKEKIAEEIISELKNKKASAPVQIIIRDITKEKLDYVKSIIKNTDIEILNERGI